MSTYFGGSHPAFLHDSMTDFCIARASSSALVFVDDLSAELTCNVSIFGREGSSETEKVSKKAFAVRKGSTLPGKGNFGETRLDLGGVGPLLNARGETQTSAAGGGGDLASSPE